MSAAEEKHCSKDLVNIRRRVTCWKNVCNEVREFILFLFALCLLSLKEQY
jgi:hypothetical protein